MTQPVAGPVPSLKSAKVLCERPSFSSAWNFV